MAITMNTMAANIYLEDENGDVLNSVYVPHMVLAEFEKAGLILKPSEAKAFHDKFKAFAKLREDKEKYSRQEYKRRVQELQKFTDREKSLINMLLSGVNQMYRFVER